MMKLLPAPVGWPHYDRTAERSKDFMHIKKGREEGDDFGHQADSDLNISPMTSRRGYLNLFKPVCSAVNSVVKGISANSNHSHTTFMLSAITSCHLRLMFKNISLY